MSTGYITIPIEEYTKLKDKADTEYANVLEQSRIANDELIEKLEKGGGLVYHFEINGKKLIGYLGTDSFDKLAMAILKETKEVKRIPKWIRKLFKCDI